ALKQTVESEGTMFAHLASGEKLTIDAKNQVRKENQLAVYTGAFGPTTNNNEWGHEIFVYNEMKVTAIYQKGAIAPGGKGATIPQGGFVLSAHGTAVNERILQVALGETITLEGVGELTPPVVAGVYVEQADGVKIGVDGHNIGRQDNKLMIYTDAYGKKTQTNQWGYEVAIDETGTVSAIRATGEGDASGMTIPKRGYVLSAHGTRRDELKTLQVGDTLTLHGLSLVDLNKSVTFSLTALNPNAVSNPDGVDATGKPFPGFRGADQLVAYDTNWTDSMTGTNDYGYELIVSGTPDVGTITAIGGNNSVIPTDGYVLSGHGEAASFLINEGLVGASVVLDEVAGTVTISVTPHSLLSSAEGEIFKAQGMYDEAKAELRDIDYEGAIEALNAAENHFEQAVILAEKLENGEVSDENQYAFLDQIDAIKANTLLVQYRTLESKAVEGRAIWHRPSEVTLVAVQATLAELQANNMNVLFLETFFNGNTIYPSDHEIAVQRPEFAAADYGQYGNDLLAAFVGEAEQYGIEVHAWVHDFFVGYEGYGSPVLEQKPEWTLLNYDGTAETKLEGGVYYFMDPSNPEVRQFLLDIYSEMVNEYEIDGLQLDYIRYPVGRYKTDTGYNKSSMDRFKADMGIDPNADIQVLMDKDVTPEWETYWNQWNEWKQNNISTFVEEAQATLKTINPELVVSTAIFADIEEAKNTKMQNWPLWVESGWIDITAPMAYYKDTQTVQNKVQDMVQYVNGNALNYAGIAPTFIGMSPEHNAYQVQAARDASAQGSAIFASQNLLGLSDVQTVFSEGTHRKTAVAPHAEIEAVLQAGLDDIVEEAEGIYIPGGYMSEEQLARFIADYENLFVQTASEVDFTSLATQTEILANNSEIYAEGTASERISEDLLYLTNIYQTRANISPMIDAEEPTPTPDVPNTDQPEQNFGPEGDVTPEVTPEADTGFGPEGDVTPEVTPEADTGFGPEGDVTPALPNTGDLTQATLIVGGITTAIAGAWMTLRRKK
ncbi:MAG: family 10 glycosylhydrolase, partial [Culicoidibacterales bacterium]